MNVLGHRIETKGMKLFLNEVLIFSGSRYEVERYRDQVIDKLVEYKKTVECYCGEKITYTSYDTYKNVRPSELCSFCNQPMVEVDEEEKINKAEEEACWGCYHDWKLSPGLHLLDGIEMSDGSIEQMCPECFAQCIQTGQAAESYAVDLGLV